MFVWHSKETQASSVWEPTASKHSLGAAASVSKSNQSRTGVTCTMRRFSSPSTGHCSSHLLPTGTIFTSTTNAPTAELCRTQQAVDSSKSLRCTQTVPTCESSERHNSCNVVKSDSNSTSAEVSVDILAEV